MDNQLVKLQMRKIGYNQGTKGIIGAAAGMEFADKQFGFLEWLQDLYDSNCLSGNFYTENIVREIWDIVRKQPDPLQKLEDGNSNLYEQLRIALSGDIDKTNGQ